MGELEILPPDFARNLAPLAGFRNILVHEYLGIDWDHVFEKLHHPDDLMRFAGHIRDWLFKKTG